ncbi:MAG: hypothetical protein ACRDT2_21640, partial [Natronosporangium sp.]
FGPLLRMTIAADGQGIAAWAAGAGFIPALALLLGTATGTHRAFQAVYVIAWYAAVNQVAAADYLGIVFVDGHRAGPAPSLIAGISFGLLALAFAIRAARHATR